MNISWSGLQQQGIDLPTAQYLRLMSVVQSAQESICLLQDATAPLVPSAGGHSSGTVSCAAASHSQLRTNTCLQLAASLQELENSSAAINSRADARQYLHQF